MSLTTRVWKVKGWGDHQQGARTGRGMGLDEWRIPSEQKNLNHNLHSLLDYGAKTTLITNSHH